MHSTTKTGTVIEVRRDYEDKSIMHVEVELPAVRRRKRRGKAATPEEWRPRSSAVVPIEFDVGVGDKVEITTTVKKHR